MLPVPDPALLALDPGLRVRLENGKEPEVKGGLARPFGLYQGT
ncbi:MAG TPA: hypothetical protein VLQ45_18375 [Thermoanaerobaculia bacterium]|nr:hypothetical protein [Thermoanaerobaculia bacterium]